MAGDIETEAVDFSCPVVNQDVSIESTYRCRPGRRVRIEFHCSEEERCRTVASVSRMSIQFDWTKCANAELKQRA